MTDEELPRAVELIELLAKIDARVRARKCSICNKVIGQVEWTCLREGEAQHASCSAVNA